MTSVRSFPAQADSVPAARAFAAETLNGLPSELTDVVLLMVSELATNSVRHADTPFEVRFETSGDTLTVSVTDAGRGVPQRRDPALSEASGRGLLIVERCSEAWGIDTDRGSTRVWFSVTIPERADADTGHARKGTTRRRRSQRFSLRRGGWALGDVIRGSTAANPVTCGKRTGTSAATMTSSG